MFSRALEDSALSIDSRCCLHASPTALSAPDQGYRHTPSLHYLKTTVERAGYPMGYTTRQITSFTDPVRKLSVPLEITLAALGFEQHCRRFLSDHDRRSIRVSCGQGWHDGSVRDAKPVDAMDLQSGIDNCHGIFTHSAGPHGVMDRGAVLLGVPRDVFFCGNGGAGGVLTQAHFT